MCVEKVFEYFSMERHRRHWIEAVVILQILGRNPCTNPAQCSSQHLHHPMSVSFIIDQCLEARTHHLYFPIHC